MAALHRVTLLCACFASPSLAAPATPRQRLRCKTTVAAGDGSFIIELRPDWAPKGVERVLALHKAGFFDNMPFFRAIQNFLIQFGISPDSQKHTDWMRAGNVDDDVMPDPPVPFTDGVVSFAGYSKDSRSTHLFITLGNQPGLGKRPWEVPVGQVVEGLDVVHGIYTGYGDKVNQARLAPTSAGAAEYLASFTQIDRIKSCALDDGRGEFPEDDNDEPGDTHGDVGGEAAGEAGAEVSEAGRAAPAADAAVEPGEAADAAEAAGDTEDTEEAADLVEGEPKEEEEEAEAEAEVAGKAVEEELEEEPEEVRQGEQQAEQEQHGDQGEQSEQAPGQLEGAAAAAEEEEEGELEEGEAVEDGTPEEEEEREGKEEEEEEPEEEKQKGAESQEEEEEEEEEEDESKGAKDEETEDGADEEDGGEEGKGDDQDEEVVAA